MPKIRAFDGYLIRKEHAEQVVAPEYDSVSAAVRREFADANPHNFLNTMRLQEDFDPAYKPSHEALLEFNKRNLQKLIANNFFQEITSPCIFIYRLVHGDHGQTGIVCEIPAEEYQQGHIRKHENTRRDKENLLALYQKTVGVSSCPISLAYPQNHGIDAFIAILTAEEPLLDFETDDGVQQKVWCIEDPETQTQLAELFEGVENTYLTDGHHRAASGWRYAEMMRESNGNNGDEPYNQLLVALFSDHELNLLPFHRCVTDLGEKTPAEVLAGLETAFKVRVVDDQDTFSPSNHGEFGMYLQGTWYKLNIHPELIDWEDPVRSLDVSILQDYILDPILGIQDYRSDPRLDYVTGVAGKAGLEKKVQDGFAVSFACFATSMDQLFRIADAGALMPPKSTYFDPKTRSGIFVRFK